MDCMPGTQFESSRPHHALIRVVCSQRLSSEIVQRDTMVDKNLFTNRSPPAQAPLRFAILPKATAVPSIIAKLNAAIVETLADPAVRARSVDQGLDIPPRGQQTPEALAAFQKAEIEKWWPIVKAAGIKGE
jgi:hypothetical protein